MTTPVIRVQDLVKTFGRFRALDGLRLEVAAGEVHGFLGPNGAGKSTTIRCLLGLLRSDAGTASVFGLDPWGEVGAIHRRLAHVPGDVTLWPNLTGGEIIDLLLRLRGVEPARSDRGSLIERFQLDPTKRARAYSKGNRQKVALVAALAGPAELLILDEPTSGLDPLMERVFGECVRERAGNGTTVLLSSHILSEVEDLAERVTIIREGRTVETGSLAELRHLRRTTITAQTPGPPPPLDALVDVHDVHVEGTTVRCSVGPEGVAGVLQALGRAGATAVTSAPPSLEELFLEVYRTGVAAAGDGS